VYLKAFCLFCPIINDEENKVSENFQSDGVGKTEEDVEQREAAEAAGSQQVGGNHEQEGLQQERPARREQGDVRRTEEEGEGKPAAAARTDDGEGEVQPDGGQVHERLARPASDPVRGVSSQVSKI
jgi:hypothetical protein